MIPLGFSVGENDIYLLVGISGNALASGLSGPVAYSNDRDAI